MPKFKNKRTGKVIEENLLYYVSKYRNHPDYEEIKEVEKNTPVTNKTHTTVKIVILIFLGSLCLNFSNFIKHHSYSKFF